MAALVELGQDTQYRYLVTICDSLLGYWNKEKGEMLKAGLHAAAPRDHIKIRIVAKGGRHGAMQGHHATAVGCTAS